MNSSKDIVWIPVLPKKVAVRSLHDS